MAGRDRDQKPERPQGAQKMDDIDEEVPLHREPRDDVPIEERDPDEVPDKDHVITRPLKARRKVD